MKSAAAVAAVVAPAPPFLTAPQVAKRLRVERMQVYRLISSGRLTAYNFGSGRKQACWRVREDDLEDYIRASCNNPRK